jgi:hypothetical protein
MKTVFSFTLSFLLFSYMMTTSAHTLLPPSVGGFHALAPLPQARTRRMARRACRTRVTLPTRAEPRTIERHAKIFRGDAWAVDECVSDAVAANACDVCTVATCECAVVVFVDGCIASVFFVIVIVVDVIVVCLWQRRLGSRERRGTGAPCGVRICSPRVSLVW